MAASRRSEHSGIMARNQPPASGAAGSKIPQQRGPMQNSKYLIYAVFPLFLWGCSGNLGVRFPWAYRIDIQQGNVVTQQMLEQVELGMTTDQVRYVLGTPLVQDPFHQDRWDYWYSFQPGGGALRQKRLSLFFRDGLLDQLEVVGDFTAEEPVAPTR